MALLSSPNAEHDKIGAAAIGDPQLLTRNDERVTVDSRAGFHRRNVRTTTGFTDGKSGNPVATNRRRQELPLLFFRAKLFDYGNGYVGLDHECHADTPAFGVTHGFEVGRRGPPIESATAPLRIYPDSEES